MSNSFSGPSDSHSPLNTSVSLASSELNANHAANHAVRSKKIATTVYITEEQQNLLKELNRRTRVPIAEFIREGIDMALARHASKLPGQLGFLNDSSQLNQLR